MANGLSNREGLLFLAVFMLYILRSEGLSLSKPRLELVPVSGNCGAVLDVYNEESLNMSVTEDSINCTLSPRQQQQIEPKMRSQHPKWYARDLFPDLLQTRKTFDLVFQDEGNLTCSIVGAEHLVSNKLLLCFKDATTVIFGFSDAPEFVIKQAMKQYEARQNVIYDVRRRHKEIVARVTFHSARNEFDGEDWTTVVLDLKSFLGNSRNFTLKYVRSTRVCPPVSEGTFSWPKTPAGRSAAPVNPCLDDEGAPTPLRRCLGDFFQGVYWDEAPTRPKRCSELTNRMQSLRNISEDICKEGSFEKMVQLVKSGSSLTATEVSLVSKSLQRSVTRNDGPSAARCATPDMASMTEIVDAVLKSGPDTVKAAEKAYGSSEAILEYIENYLCAVASSETLTFSNSRFSFLSAKAGSQVTGFAAYGSWSSSDPVTMEPLSRSNFSDIHARGPKVAAILQTDDADVGLSSIVYRETSFFNSVEGDRRLIGPVVGLKLYRRKESAAGSTVTLLLLFSRELNNDGGKPICSFWDTRGRSNKWSSFGCELIEKETTIPPNMYGCLCTHLTNFALLISFHDYVDDPALTTITVVGCSISIVCLAATFLYAALTPKWHRNVYRKIELNLFASVALLDAAELIVASLEVSSRHDNHFSASCIAMGVVLHYSVLATFAWMIVLAGLQFLRLNPGTLIDARRRAGTHLLLKASIFAWGVPAVPVISTLSLGTDLYVLRHQSATCYPVGVAFYAGVLFPVTLAIVLNTIVFAFILRTLFCFRPVTSCQKESWFRKTTRRVFYTLFLFCLLGLNWIVGIFLELAKSNEAAYTVFRYLFCSTATLHGLSLFIFLVLCENSVWARIRDAAARLPRDVRGLSTRFSTTGMFTVRTSAKWHTTNDASSFPSFTVVDRSEAVND